MLAQVGAVSTGNAEGGSAPTRARPGAGGSLLVLPHVPPHTISRLGTCASPGHPAGDMVITLTGVLVDCAALCGA